jgi:Kef-type K+ transport system membrane component KefB
VARVPLFLLAIYLARGLPAFVYVRLLGRSRSVIAGVLQSTSLPFIVAATQIGLGLGVVTRASAAGLVAAGLLSVVISPTLGLVLLRRQQSEPVGRRELPSAITPELDLARVGAGAGATSFHQASRAGSARPDRT